MNFLAHARLSFNYKEILVGNMISDFVKGKRKFDYPNGIQQGIFLHRQIDAFTDFHEATKEAKAFFKPAVGLYSGAFVDVAYDHFLANDLNEFTDLSLKVHSSETYEVLETNFEGLPPFFQTIFPYMKSQNWLYNYRTLAGIKNSFASVAKRATYLDNSEAVFDLFQKNYSQLQQCYNAFFPFVKAFSLNQIELLTS